MENELGILLKKLRGFNSLRTIAEKANGKISHTKLDNIEKGKTQPSLEDLKTLSEAYSYQYEKFLIIAGYLTEKSENKVNKLIEEFNNLSDCDKEKFIKSLNIK